MDPILAGWIQLRRTDVEVVRAENDKGIIPIYLIAMLIPNRRSGTLNHKLFQCPGSETFLFANLLNHHDHAIPYIVKVPTLEDYDVPVTDILVYHGIAVDAGRSKSGQRHSDAAGVTP